MKSVALFSAVVSVLAMPLIAGRIVVNHDEWTLSNTGYVNAGVANADSFAVNLANFLAGPGGKILIYSSNFGLTQSDFLTCLNTAGFDVTVSTGAFDLAGYDAVLLGGSEFSADAAVLTDFVNNGGGVYIAAGTGIGGAAAEAARWNPFLAPFGFLLDSPYNLFTATNPIDNPALPLFTGVSSLYYANGNTVTLNGMNPHASIVEMSSPTGFGLIGVYQSDAAVPEPGTTLLLVSGFLLMGARWKFRD